MSRGDDGSGGEGGAPPVPGTDVGGNVDVTLDPAQLEVVGSSYSEYTYVPSCEEGVIE